MLSIASVPRLWPEATIVCVGSGPSLTPADLSYLWTIWRASPHLRVITINDAWRLARWADVLYAPDPVWWTWHGMAAADGFAGRKYTLALHEHNLAWACGADGLNFRSGVDVSDDPSLIYTGGHAGYQAPQLAAHLGARRIVLLGYDMQPDPDGRHHFFGDHPDGSHVPYETWIASYQTLLEKLQARDIHLINVSRETAITAVPRISLAQALA